MGTQSVTERYEILPVMKGEALASRFHFDLLRMNCANQPLLIRNGFVSIQSYSYRHYFCRYGPDRVATPIVLSANEDAAATAIWFKDLNAAGKTAESKRAILHFFTGTDLGEEPYGGNFNFINRISYELYAVKAPLARVY